MEMTAPDSSAQNRLQKKAAGDLLSVNVSCVFLCSHLYILQLKLLDIDLPSVSFLMHTISYCLMHRSVNFDFQFAIGIKPSDIIF